MFMQTKEQREWFFLNKDVVRLIQTVDNFIDNCRFPVEFVDKIPFLLTDNDKKDDFVGMVFEEKENGVYQGKFVDEDGDNPLDINLKFAVDNNSTKRARELIKGILKANLINPYWDIMRRVYPTWIDRSIPYDEKEITMDKEYEKIFSSEEKPEGPEEAGKKEDKSFIPINNHANKNSELLLLIDGNRITLAKKDDLEKIKITRDKNEIFTKKKKMMSCGIY